MCDPGTAIAVGMQGAGMLSNAASARKAADATQANLDRQTAFDRETFDKKQVNIRENDAAIRTLMQQQQQLQNTAAMEYLTGQAGITTQQQRLQQQAIDAQKTLLEALTGNRITATNAQNDAFASINSALTDRSNAWSTENAARTAALNSRGSALTGVIADRANAVSAGSAARADAQNRLADIFQREAAREKATMGAQSDITNKMITDTSFASAEAARQAAAAGAALSAQSAIAGGGGADTSTVSDLTARTIAAKEAAARERVGGAANAGASLFGYQAAGQGIGDALAAARVASAQEAQRYSLGGAATQYDTKLAQTDFDNAGAATQGRLALSDANLRVADAGLAQAFGLSTGNMNIADAALAKAGGLGQFDLNQAAQTQAGANDLAQGGLKATLRGLDLDNAKLTDALNRLNLTTEAKVSPESNYLNTNIDSRANYIQGLTGATDAYHQSVTNSNNFVLQNIRANTMLGDALSKFGSMVGSVNPGGFDSAWAKASQAWGNLWRPSQSLEGGYLNKGNGMYGRV